MFDDSPLPGDAGELAQVDGHHFCVRGKCSDGTPYDGDAGGVLELGNAGDDVGAAGRAPSSDAGDGVLVHDAGSVEPTNPGVSDAGPLEHDANVSDTNDAGVLEQNDASTGPQLCTDMCIDGTFRCPSASSKNGFVCRSWPPCYCMPDGG